MSLLRNAIAALLAASAVAVAAPSHVTLSHANDAWQLMRDGQPYFIKGAGGGESKTVLATLGANSFRTWGVGGDTQSQLDEANKLGLTVTLGIWLRREGDNHLSYKNEKQVADQLESARKAILQYKDSPALLCWGLGNEMEGYKAGDDPAVWNAVEAIAKLCKQLDPNHPTMTVIAEVGGARVKSIEAMCPDVDIVGIDSYGGAASIGDRYLKAGDTKPYVVTEFGPPLSPESPKTKWNAPIEPTSTKKADIYKQDYLKGVLSHQTDVCLGSYAFTWGHKQEATATWYGLLLPDGTQLAPVHALSELWTGHPPANACPTIETPTLDADDVAPNAVVHATLVTSDADHDPLTVRWELSAEAAKHAPGGTGNPAPPTFPAALADATLTGVTVTLPTAPGSYRLFAYVKDDHGNGAVANVPLHVGAPTGK